MFIFYFFTVWFANSTNCLAISTDVEIVKSLYLVVRFQLYIIERVNYLELLFVKS